ncbi:MAG: hypothetical protein EOM41_01250 [Bacilli bacterium]|nr:hypothetical protein [Bacilli bacterium]
MALPRTTIEVNMEINLLFLLKCFFSGMFVLSMGWLNENRKSLKTKITALEERVSTNEKRISSLKYKIDTIETTLPATIDEKLQPIQETLQLMTTVITTMNNDIRTLLRKVEENNHNSNKSTLTEKEDTE